MVKTAGKNNTFVYLLLIFKGWIRKVQQYSSSNDSGQTARMASEIYRGASDISKATMKAGAQVIKTAAAEAATVTGTHQYPTQTAFEESIKQIRFIPLKNKSFICK
jgi:hypothetical protein